MVRHEAVQVAGRLQVLHGLSIAAAGERLWLDPETIRSWIAAAATGQLTAKRRGRPPKSLDREQRQAVIGQLDQQAGLGVPALRRQRPEVGRNALAELVARHRVVRQRRHRRGLQHLSWQAPGAVWAIDGTWLPSPVLGQGRISLVVADITGAGVLDCAAVTGESSQEVIRCLDGVFARHGTPLVLKLDNGPGFRSDETRAFCASQGVTLLHSPPHCPRFNGACEVHNRWAKQRILRAARRAGSEGILLSGDLAAARSGRSPAPVPEGLRQAFLAALAEHRSDLCRQWGLADLNAARHSVRAALDRVAVQRALLQCHILKIGGRAFDGGCSPRTPRN